MNEEEKAEAKAELADLTKRYRRADAARTEAARAALAKAVEMIRGGIAPTEVVKLSPFTDSYIRKAAREAGLPPLTTPRGITAREAFAAAEGRPEGRASKAMRAKPPAE